VDLVLEQHEPGREHDQNAAATTLLASEKPARRLATKAIETDHGDACSSRSAPEPARSSGISQIFFRPSSRSTVLLRV